MTPLLLLDDVMSELDPGRRERLVDRLGDGGQALITAADEESVPARLLGVGGADAAAADRKCRRVSRRRAPRPAAGAYPAAPRPSRSENRPGGGAVRLVQRRRRAARGGRRSRSPNAPER